MSDAETPDEKAIFNLEWRTLLDRIASRTVSEAGARHVRQLAPAASIEEARERAALTRDAAELLADGAPIPVSAVPDLLDVLDRLERNAVATGPEFAGLGRLLAAEKALRSFLVSHREAHPVLAARLATNPTLDRLREAIVHAVDEDGEVLDRASPELSRARKRAADARRELSARLSELMNRYADVLRDRFYTERDGRFVLPVRADAHHRVDGIVFGSSASGGTLYVEPKEITELGNRRHVADAEVEREIARVLGALSITARASVADLRTAREAVLLADALLALARFGEAAEATVVAVDDGSEIHVRGMRHPLLIGGGTGAREALPRAERVSGGLPRRERSSRERSEYLGDGPVRGMGDGTSPKTEQGGWDTPLDEVVGSDLTLARGRGLVISGPNAGGKTVALKCLGLAVWMARAGIPIPAGEGSHVGWFDPILTDIGDEQSLARSLSTFSAHAARLAAYLAEARPGAVVLLDEVAAGTDPDEGAALATAVLERLVASGAAVAVTTHYDRLKQLAAHDDRFENASVGFDFATMRPTFRVTLGVPGASSALAVASRYGIPEDVVARAQTLIPQANLTREALLAEIEVDRTRAAEERRAAETDAREQARLRTELEDEVRHVRERERARLAREGSDLTAAVRDARNQLREATSRLKKGGELDRDALRDIEKVVNAAGREVAVGGRLDAALRGTVDAGPAGPSEATLSVGDTVYVPKLRAHAEVLEAPSRGQVKVSAGAMKLALRLDELRLPAPGTRAPSPKPAKKPRPAAPPVRHDATPVRTDSITCDVRGLRVDETLERVDAFIDRLLSQGEPAGFVLHGHGTGALKSAIREHLGAHHLVERARPGGDDEGGDAFTVFWTAG